MQLTPFILNFILFAALKCWGQDASPTVYTIPADYRLQIIKSTGPINLDGDLNEPDWTRCAPVTQFWEKFPKDDKMADRTTEVRVMYNDQYLYIGARLEASGKPVVQTLKRDVDFEMGDGFSIVLDPVNKRTNGFTFGVSPLGVQMEGLIGRFDFNTNWDQKWFSEVKNYPDHWEVEMAIPFRSLRYSSDITEWGINFIRHDIRNNQIHCWSRIPFQFEVIDLNYTGILVWDQPPPATKGNVNILPYTSLRLDNDFTDPNPTQTKVGAGVDAKIAVNSSLNLDLTVNPDFSQVEVDAQMTNLTRFSLFFPEKRTFFLENADLFSSFGFPGFQPFFSRRVGLDESGQPIPILMGMRLSGNLSDNWRLGLINMQTGPKDEFKGQNYTAVTLHRRVLANSNIKALFINRQAFSDGHFEGRDFGRNASVELTYTDPAGKIAAWTNLHGSFRPDANGLFHYHGLFFNNRKISLLANVLTSGSDYYADMGFVSRLNNYDALRDTLIREGFTEGLVMFDFRSYPTQSKINVHSTGFDNVTIFDPFGKLTFQYNTFRHLIAFSNTSSLQFKLNTSYTYLKYPFAFADGAPLPADDYTYLDGAVEYKTDARKPLSFNALAGLGGFYNGDRTFVGLSAKYRLQPYANFTFGLEYNHLIFPSIYGEAKLFLINPRIEVYFSRNLNWTTFLQYNTQEDNFNINSRLQWRFRPMSDFFLVFTDNHALDPFIKKNRTLVVKLNYWFSL